MIISKQNIISRILEYNKHCNTEFIAKAYDMCEKYHKNQFRKSGEPYFYHPIAVAEQVIDMRLDDVSIIIAILHDILEDTEVTKDILEKEFSLEIADLVDGVTKLDRIKFQPDQVKQAENFRKLFLALSRDVRVLIIKLCDRLHNMQTIEFQGSKSKIRRISIETLEIYAPLAERIGMYKMRDELQDLAFATINNRARISVIKKLEHFDKRFTQNENILDYTVKEFHHMLQKQSISNAIIYGRKKTPYSIWKKLIRKDISFDKISDVIGFRIIVQDVEDCYRVLGALHRNYRAIPETFTDYISVPKTNGYESIHAAILGPCNNRIEVQIRTKEMDLEAEYGLAAHWSYKQNIEEVNTRHVTTIWIQKVLQILNSSSNAEEFLEATKLEMYQEQIFVFTPHGDIVSLPNKAKVIDFAFAVHDDLGLFCSGAKIDGKIVDIDHMLKNGDQIKIITSNKVWPKLDWLNFAITGKAKISINKAADQEAIEYTKIRGMNMLYHTFAKYNQSVQEKDLDSIVQLLNRKNIDSVYIDAANGVIDIYKIAQTILNKNNANDESCNESKDSQNETKDMFCDVLTHANKKVIINGIDRRLAYYIARCCNPCKRDEIVGIIEPCCPIAIHSRNCKILNTIHLANESQMIDLTWHHCQESRSL